MRRSKTRYQLWQIMLAIAVLAGLFAGFGVTGGLAIAILSGVIVFPIRLAGQGSRLRAAAWVASLYPLLLLASLYGTWFTAWVVLGHRPRSSLDDPKFISPVVEVPYGCTFLSLITMPFSLFVSIPLMTAARRPGHQAEETAPRKSCGPDDHAGLGVACGLRLPELGAPRHRLHHRMVHGLMRFICPVVARGAPPHPDLIRPLAASGTPSRRRRPRGWHWRACPASPRTARCGSSRPAGSPPSTSRPGIHTD